MEEKSFVHSKAFAVFAICFGVLGLLMGAHNIFSYEQLLRPQIDFLITNKIITNDVNGITFLYFFTYQSNVFVDLYLILFGAGVLGSRKLWAFTHREGLRCALTLYIFITGLIYCGLLLPFAKSSFPMEKGIWFSNVINVWNHMLTPALFTAFWFVPITDQIIPVCRTAWPTLIYPFSYFVFSEVRGAFTNFYPYPFLNGPQVWDVLFGGKPYNAPAALAIVTAVFLGFCVLFYSVSCALFAIHNALVRRQMKQTASADRS